MKRKAKQAALDAAQALQAESAQNTQTDFRGFRRRAERMTDCVIDAMFPRHAKTPAAPKRMLREASKHLVRCLSTVLSDADRAEAIAGTFFGALPEVFGMLRADLEAAYRGDPAAHSVDEIILCYPAFFAICTYRLAHVLYRAGVPLLPRVMTEYAHQKTGIDIHPGAQIGEEFFIDHGTGVVIGETCTIGRNVKIYQHVTLGAKSFNVDGSGALVKGIKRHPDIGDRVVIYSGATILGGETQIGNDCIIGGSVWLTHSVEAGKMVLARSTVTDAPLTRDVMHASVLDSALL